jgi:hypothetical protein
MATSTLDVDAVLQSVSDAKQVQQVHAKMAADATNGATPLPSNGSGMELIFHKLQYSVDIAKKYVWVWVGNHHSSCFFVWIATRRLCCMG